MGGKLLGRGIGFVFRNRRRVNSPDLGAFVGRRGRLLGTSMVLISSADVLNTSLPSLAANLQKLTC